jgi:hypothetical protein
MVIDCEVIKCNSDYLVLFVISTKEISTSSSTKIDDILCGVSCEDFSFVEITKSSKKISHRLHRLIFKQIKKNHFNLCNL